VSAGKEGKMRLSGESADSNGVEDAKLGIAGRIARTFINTPVTPMLLIGALCLGLLGLFFTPRQEDPQISVPMIDIFVQYPGTTAQQVESLVTEPLERIMKEIPGVRHVYSATMRGQAIVTVRFFVGEEMGDSIVKVHDKLQSNLDKIPPDVKMPLVKPVSVDDVPVVTVTLWSRDVDDSQLRLLALDVLQELNEVPKTGKGFVVGGRADQIRVEVLMERLAGYRISLDQVANTIQTANAELQTGALESGGAAFNVYSGAFLKTANDIAELVVGIRDGQPVYVRDVATIQHLPEEAKHVVQHFTGPAYEGDRPANGESAVTIAIAKKEGTNGVAVARAILEKLEKLKGRLIPTNVEVEITRDYGKTANDKVNELLSAMFEATVIVSILCLVGLGYRAAFVVITVIPVVILLTIWWAWMVDYTIDRVSLFALIFSIGILVDDATVVVENIFRHWLEVGKTSISQAIRAVDEVGNPTILATFTIIAALLPMGWVSGLMGPYMRPIPVLGSSAMFFSLIAAFVFTPWFAMRVRPRMAALEKAERREERTRRFVSKIYRPIVMPLIENRKLGIIFLVAVISTTAFVCVLFYTKTVPVKMLPFDNKPEFSVIVNMPEGTAVPKTANVVRKLADKVRDIPEVRAVQSYSGTAQPFNFNGMVRHYYLRENPWEGDLLVILKDKNERERGSHAIATEARRILTPIAKEAGAKIAVVEMPPGPPVLQTVVAEVYGPDAQTRRQVAADMTRMFEDVENIVDADNYMTDSYEYWRFTVDTEKAVRRGISVNTVNQNLAMAMGGHRIGDVKRGTVQEPTYIVIQVPLANRAQITSLGSLPIRSTDGGLVPLAELGEFERVEMDPIIYHKDLRPMEYVVGEMEGRLGAPIYGMFGVEDLLEEYTTPDGEQITGMPWGLIGPPEDDGVSGFEWTGEWTVTYETFRDMGLAFMAALVLIYGLIVWEFRNFALAGLIMSPIPLTLIGIIPGHLIMGAEFTATSMIGLIALGGIIVRQSILIVEFVKIEVAKGKTVREAAVAGAEIRMRPIFITSLTLMAGAWAIIFDPIFEGMAVSLLFGAGVATVMAVIVIPLGCISARKQFYLVQTEDGDTELSGRFAEIEQAEPSTQRSGPAGLPMWMVIWSKTFVILSWVFLIVRAVVIMLWQVIKALIARFRSSRQVMPGPSGGPPSSGSSPSGSAPGGGGGAPSGQGSSAPRADQAPAAVAGTAASGGGSGSAVQKGPATPARPAAVERPDSERLKQEFAPVGVELSNEVFPEDTGNNAPDSVPPAPAERKASSGTGNDSPAAASGTRRKKAVTRKKQTAGDLPGDGGDVKSPPSAAKRKSRPPVKKARAGRRTSSVSASKAKGSKSASGGSSGEDRATNSAPSAKQPEPEKRESARKADAAGESRTPRRRVAKKAVAKKPARRGIRLRPEN
jgi:multidrug efflux pump subunit AcrB